MLRPITSFHSQVKALSHTEDSILQNWSQIVRSFSSTPKPKSWPHPSFKRPSQIHKTAPRLTPHCYSQDSAPRFTVPLLRSLWLGFTASQGFRILTQHSQRLRVVFDLEKSRTLRRASQVGGPPRWQRLWVGVLRVPELQSSHRRRGGGGPIALRVTGIGACLYAEPDRVPRTLGRSQRRHHQLRQFLLCHADSLPVHHHGRLD